MKFSSLRFAPVWLVVILCVAVGVASAQEYRARVQGSITDPSQAAVVGAKVTLRNMNTGIETSRETDAMGRYLFDFVQPGTYAISAEMSGFNRAAERAGRRVRLQRGRDATGSPAASA